MNEQDPKPAANYKHELKERQRLFGSGLNSKSPTEPDYIFFKTDEPGQYILEYVGGRRVLVEIDEASGQQRFLREL